MGVRCAVSGITGNFVAGETAAATDFDASVKGIVAGTSHAAGVRDHVKENKRDKFKVAVELDDGLQ